MDQITIPHLNDRAYSALNQRLGDPRGKLHGILNPSPKSGMTQVLWPYGITLGALEGVDRLRCDDTFYKGRVSLYELLACYVRSCQLLRFAVRQLEQRMEDDLRELKAHLGGPSWTVEIDLEALYNEFHANIDVSIHIDSCISYLKILADGVAKTIPSLFMAPPFPVSRESMNTLWNDALQRAGSPLERVFSSTPRTWLDILSKSRRSIAGIRDARFHHGAWIVATGYSNGDEPFCLVIQQSSVGSECIGSQLGETIRDAVLHSRDLVSDLSTAAYGFFSFLDHIIRQAAGQNTSLSPIHGPYSKVGYIVAYGPSTFLSTLLPVV